MSRRNGRLGPDIGGRVREPGASPGRSRRCKGRRCPTTMPLADAGKAVEQGAPSQKTCRPSIRTPRGRRIRVSTHPHALRGRGTRARDRRLRLGRSRSRARRRQEPARSSARRNPARRRRPRSAHSSRPASAASSTTTSSRPASARTSTRSAAIRPEGSSGWAFKVNGASPPVGADKVELKNGDVVLWYWATFTRCGRPADARAHARREAAATGSWPRNDAGGNPSPSPRTLRVDARRVPMARAVVPCPGPHRSLVRAIAPGAVRSNALKYRDAPARSHCSASSPRWPAAAGPATAARRRCG